MPDPRNTPTDWCLDPMPAVDGWFAVIRCWEPEEGMSAQWCQRQPTAVQVTGGTVDWPDGNGMTIDASCHAGPFPTQIAALAWAYSHNPEDPRWRRPHA
jgi:hypothetical protein